MSSSCLAAEGVNGAAQSKPESLEFECKFPRRVLNTHQSADSAVWLLHAATGNCRRLRALIRVIVHLADHRVTVGSSSHCRIIESLSLSVLPAKLTDKARLFLFPVAIFGLLKSFFYAGTPIQLLNRELHGEAGHSSVCYSGHLFSH